MRNTVGTWLSLVEHSLGVRGVGSSNLPVPTIQFSVAGSQFSVENGRALRGFFSFGTSSLRDQYRLRRGPVSPLIPKEGMNGAPQDSWSSMGRSDRVYGAPGRPFDYVVTDYRMPGDKIRNGIELVAAIKQIERTQPIFLQTSEEGLQAPCPVILKPYRFERLLRLFRKPVQPLLF